MAARTDTPIDQAAPAAAAAGPDREILLALVQAMPTSVVITDTQSRITWCNDAFCRLIQRREDAIIGQASRAVAPLDHTDANTLRRLRDTLAEQQPFTGTIFIHDGANAGRSLHVDVRPLVRDGVMRGYLTLATDITARLAQEQRLELSERMASMGTLATGVAHEINTPVQFVSDSLHFLRDAAADLATVIGSLTQVRQAVLDGHAAGDLATASLAADDDADLPYLLEHVPKAVASCLDGVDRVATIVRSVKEFAHPHQAAMAAADLNHAIASTLTLARNEYKYVAELVTDFGDLPPVRCLIGGINQVVLNLVVNAAHAIGAKVKGTGSKGTITVRTRRDGDHVTIAIQDTGGGVPADIREHIFESFFTTKPMGQGTGQGLPLARSIVAQGHGGTLTFESVPGEGTTFHVRLPIQGQGCPAAGVAA